MNSNNSLDLEDPFSNFLIYGIVGGHFVFQLASDLHIESLYVSVGSWLSYMGQFTYFENLIATVTVI